VGKGGVHFIVLSNALGKCVEMIMLELWSVFRFWIIIFLVQRNGFKLA